MASDLIFRNSEWEIDGALICAEVELTISVAVEEGEPAFWLYECSYLGQPSRRGGWLFPAMQSWVEQNQEKLAEQYHYERGLEDAA